METNLTLAVTVGVVIVSVLAIGVAKVQRWPEGRKRALRRRKKRKVFLIK